MRDLDQLEERDPQDRGRRTGMAVVFGILVLLMLAVGSMMSQAASPRAEGKPDPLDQLDRVMGDRRATHVNAARDPEPSGQAVQAPPVDATELTFQRELTEEEDRPEVLEALAAAAREEERLAQENAPAKPSGREPAPPSAAAHSAAAEASDEEDEEEEAAAAPARVTKAVLKAAAREPASKDTTKQSGAKAAPNEKASSKDSKDKDATKESAKAPVKPSMPAGLVASTASQKLAKAARHDHLVAAALPGKPELPKARAGADGEFTLQVISYDTLATAQAFANELRVKGHEAFVAAGDVEGRGRYYRVRIGPFKTKPQAEAYRHSFEAQEAMNTIVVKRPDR